MSVENKVYNPVPHLQVGDRVEILQHPSGSSNPDAGKIATVTGIKVCIDCGRSKIVSPYCPGLVALKVIGKANSYPKACFHYANKNGFLFYGLKKTSLDNAEE